MRKKINNKDGNRAANVAGTICGTILLACIGILAIFATIKAITLMFGF